MAGVLLPDGHDLEVASESVSGVLVMMCQENVSLRSLGMS
jgi:hypothetical protein